MAENINLNKRVFNKRDYPKTIDTFFSELGVKDTQDQIDAQPTVQEFFNMYNTLFYQINELGPTNSHEYLIKTSKEYIGFEEDNSLVEALQKEISNLRLELLRAQQDLANLAKAIPEAPEIKIPELPSSPEDVEIKVEVNTPTPTTPPTPEPTEAEKKKDRVIKLDDEGNSVGDIKDETGYKRKYIRNVINGNI